MDKLYSVSAPCTTPQVPEEARGGWRLYPVWGVDESGICLCPKGENCGDPGKHPVATAAPRGFNSASSDPREIERMFSVAPRGSNVGLATGRASGVVILDEDTYGGASSLTNLEAEHGALPRTRLHQTGGGGLHRPFAYPEGPGWLPTRTGEGALAPGLELLADGGAAVLPPSRHALGGLYELLIDRPLAVLPEWIAEMATRPRVVEVGDEGDARPGRSRYRLPERIPEGARDNELFGYGCSLRADGRDHGAILEELRRVNAERCVPPLPDRQVRTKAGQAARYAKGNPSLAVTPKVLTELDEIQEAVLGAVWPGVGGKSERSLMIALILAARRHGTLIPAGVRISLDTRTLAEMSGMSRRTLVRAVPRLRRSGLLRKDDKGRGAFESGAFVLVSKSIVSLPRAPRAQRHHSTTPPSHTPSEGEWKSGDGLRAPRLRHKGSLGKTDEAAIDALEAADGWMAVEELAAAVGVNRVRDFRRRTVNRLEAAKVVEVEGGRVGLRKGWLEAIDMERTLSGEKRAETLDKAEHEHQREAYRMWLSERKEEPG